MSYPLLNNILLAVIGFIVLVIIYFIFRSDGSKEKEYVEEDCFSISYLKEAVRSRFNEIINQNIAELYLNRSETKKREQQKARVKSALRSCAQGNIGEKEFVKDYIKDLLQNQLKVNEATIDCIIPFEQISKLTSQDKFEILLWQYKKDYGYDGFERLSEDCGFEGEKINKYGPYYEVTAEDIDLAFSKLAAVPSYMDKLELVTQRIYQEVYGFSVIDEIRDMKIDGCSGGVSGISREQYYYMEEVISTETLVKPMTYDSIWVFIHGKPIHLSFLSFGSMNELIRVCKNLYRYDNVGHLTSSNGYKLSYLQDGSRVVVVRPKLTAGWAFFLRKFDSAKKMPITTLVRDEGNEILIELVKWAVKGCLNIIISGDQNSGKTTFLKAILQFIDQRYPIRTTEQEFELWISDTYPHLNVASFRGSEEVSLIESIDIQKKTDGAIMILGEVASSNLASAYISLTQSGTKSTMCTCHCVTTESLVDYFRNAVLASGTFSNEMIAEEQVANSIDLDIHWEKAGNGHRYISHITEIIPNPREVQWPEDNNQCISEALKRLARGRSYTTREIIVYENGRYVSKNSISPKTIEKINRNLDNYEQEEFMTFLNRFFNDIEGGGS